MTLFQVGALCRPEEFLNGRACECLMFSGFFFLNKQDSRYVKNLLCSYKFFFLNGKMSEICHAPLQIVKRMPQPCCLPFYWHCRAKCYPRMHFGRQMTLSAFETTLLELSSDMAEVKLLHKIFILSEADLYLISSRKGLLKKYLRFGSKLVSQISFCSVKEAWQI